MAAREYSLWDDIFWSAVVLFIMGVLVGALYAFYQHIFGV